MNNIEGHRCGIRGRIDWSKFKVPTKKELKSYCYEAIYIAMRNAEWISLALVAAYALKNKKNA
jgi:hypothetical protein